MVVSAAEIPGELIGNTATARAAFKRPYQRRCTACLDIDLGHVMLGVRNAFRGLINNEIADLDWMSVNGWATRAGSELGTNRTIPKGRDLYAIARNLEEHQIDGILMIGGWSGYESILELHNQRKNYPAFDIPMLCLPATINNNLPGTSVSATLMSTDVPLLFF